MFEILIHWGHDEEYVLNLDIVSFNTLVERVMRLRAIDKREYALTLYHSRGSPKNMNEWLARWDAAIGKQDTVAGDQTAFLLQFGGGI